MFAVIALATFMIVFAASIINIALRGARPAFAFPILPTSEQCMASTLVNVTQHAGYAIGAVLRTMVFSMATAGKTNIRPQTTKSYRMALGTAIGLLLLALSIELVIPPSAFRRIAI